MSNTPITGRLPNRFEAVRAAIARNQTENDEMGFQFCIMRQGEVLIDICSGYADKAQTARFWRE